MTGEEILNLEKCGDLFPWGEKEVKKAYLELAKIWHPDSNKDPLAPQVFAKINELYRRALTCLEEDIWEKTNSIMFTKEDGKHVTLNYKTYFDFELGRCYVSQSKVVYCLQKEKYYDNALKRLQNMNFADTTMKEKLEGALPELYRYFVTSKGQCILIFNKQERVLPLKLVLAYFHEVMDPRHVAWIISRLSNLACFLAFNGLVHNGINLDSCFIDPEEHRLILMGGWWYTTNQGEKMLGTTKDIFEVMSVKAKGDKLADVTTDLEAIKLLGRQLLGETNSRQLALESKAPKPLIDFLVSGSKQDPYLEFEKWDNALLAGYGKRRFIPMVIDKSVFDKMCIDENEGGR